MTFNGRPAVGFVINDTGSGWVGGSNYLSNLLHALAMLPDRQIETVLVAAPAIPAADLVRFPTDRILRSDRFEPRSPARLVGKVSERLLGRNLVAEQVCRRAGIDLLSHVTPIGARSSLPTIAWIPDFQEIHLPVFFSDNERRRRAEGHRRIVEQATLIVLSSEDARQDLLTIHPEARERTRVLHFTTGAQTPGAIPTLAALRSRYNLPEHYFYLPNQLWAHKNHAVVIEALALLKARGRAVRIVSTGHVEDYRNPDFQQQIRDRIAAAGLEDLLRIEGLVPYDDVRALLAYSVAVINPSRFEGWSTTVEEAKSLGKRVLLSDIPVHREQDPERGAFFATDDPAALASLIEQALAEWDPQTERHSAERAARMLPPRIVDFARCYERIVLDAAGRP